MGFSRAEIRSLILIASLYLVRMLGLFTVLPVLSLQGLGLDGATPVLLGLALGVYGLTQAMLQIPFGWASDRWGRKPLLLFGFSLFLLGSLMCSQADDIWILVAGRALQGAGAVSAVLLALIADRIESPNRTLAMAFIGVSIGLAFAISMVIGPVIASVWGLSGLFDISTVFALTAMVAILLWVREPDRTTLVRSRQNYWVRLSPTISRLNLSIFMLHFLQMCIWVAVPGVLLEQLGLAIDQHWLVYLVAVGGGFLLMAPFMRIWDRKGMTRQAILVAIVVLCLATLLLSQSQSFSLFMFGLFSFFWGFNLLEATLPSALTRAAPEEQRGVATGVYSTCQFLGTFCGGILGGWLLAGYGSQMVFAVGGVFGACWLLWLLPSQKFSPNWVPDHSTGKSK